jgi:hypothetical protein
MEFRFNEGRLIGNEVRRAAEISHVKGGDGDAITTVWN